MKTRQNFTLSPEVIATLRALATQTGISMSAIIELAVRDWAAKQVKP